MKNTSCLWYDKPLHKKVEHAVTDRNYTDELLRRLEQRAWPELANAEFLERLDNLAEEAHRCRTLDGSLAALLIYHQLVEDMTRVLVESARFFLQLSIFPLELRFKDPSKPMMGYWVQQLEEMFDFDGKLEFTKRVKELNQLRNQLFHGITK
jgi:hypothetical protein